MHPQVYSRVLDQELEYLSFSSQLYSKYWVAYLFIYSFHLSYVADLVELLKTSHLCHSENNGVWVFLSWTKRVSTLLFDI